MKFLVFGCGAIGSVFAGFLKLAGHDLVLLGREKHMHAIEDQGLTITGIWGKHKAQGFKLYTNPRILKDRENGDFDAVLLTVKSYDTELALLNIVDMVNKDTLVISLQNGLGNIEKIAKAVGKDRTIGGRVIFGAAVLEPAKVKVTVSADEVVIGSILNDSKNNQTQERLDSLTEEFNKAGIKTRTDKEITKVIWSKVLYNASLNGLASIMEIPYGDLLKYEETRKDMIAIISETYAVANKAAIDLNPATPEKYIKLLFEKLIPATAYHLPSMLQDLRRGKRTEIDALNGAISKLGKKVQVKTPVNDELVKLIKEKEKQCLK